MGDQLKNNRNITIAIVSWNPAFGALWHRLSHSSAEGTRISTVIAKPLAGLLHAHMFVMDSWMIVQHTMTRQESAGNFKLQVHTDLTPPAVWLKFTAE